MITDEQLNNTLESMALSIRHRLDAKRQWDETFNKLSYRPVAYSNASLDYQFAYQRGHGGNWREISLIIYWDNKPAALWPLSFSVKDGQSILTSHGLPVLPPIFVADCPPVSRKQIIKRCLDFSYTTSVIAQQHSWQSGESFVEADGLSEWHMQSMARNAVCHLQHELYQDLRPDISAI